MARGLAMQALKPERVVLFLPLARLAVEQAIDGTAPYCYQPVALVAVERVVGAFWAEMKAALREQEQSRALANCNGVAVPLAPQSPF